MKFADAVNLFTLLFAIGFGFYIIYTLPKEN